MQPKPGFNKIELLPLLDQPAPKLRAYPPESVIAEKFSGHRASRPRQPGLKDLYDIWVLARTYASEDERLALAIRATFDRRKTPNPTEPPDGSRTPPSRTIRPSSTIEGASPGCRDQSRFSRGRPTNAFGLSHAACRVQTLDVLNLQTRRSCGKPLLWQDADGKVTRVSWDGSELKGPPKRFGAITKRPHVGIPWLASIAPMFEDADNALP
jgi:hypothetical protein